MEKTFSIKTTRGTLNIKGELSLINTSEIWGKLNNLSDSINKINLSEIKALDVSILQQLILIKLKHEKLKITAEIPGNIHSVIENCQMTHIFSSLTVKN